MKKTKIFLFLLLLSVANCSVSQIKSSEELFNGMSLIGSADFRYLFWKIYTAELYSENDAFEYFNESPLVLKLTYKRGFTASQLMTETRKQFEMLELPEESIKKWIENLQAIYIDVSPDDTIILYIDNEASSHFYFNSRYLGTVKNEDFSRYFSAIWLARQDRYANFSDRLTGATK
jgi:hypothetical protein